MYIKAYFLYQRNTTKLTNSEKNRMVVMIVNSKIKHQSETMLEVIRYQVLDFILYIITAYMRKYSIHATSARGTSKIHYTSLEEVSKNLL